ncbi:MAG: HD domain-containing protein [Acidobacteriota bacterium]|jgi:putative nucleotidyltransferase with HDIG domain
MSISSLFRRPRLRHILFLALLLSGIIPLVLFNTLLIRQNRDRLESEERTELTEAAELLSREVGDELDAVRSSLRQLGAGLLAFPAPGGSDDMQDLLRQPWVESYLHDFRVADAGLIVLRVLDREGMGRELGPGGLPDAVRAARDAAFEEARDSGRTAFRFAVMPSGGGPVASTAVPVGGSDGPELVVEALVRLPLMEGVFRREARGESAIFLVDAAGTLLWSEGASDAAREALLASGVATGGGSVAMAMTREYDVDTEDGPRNMLAQVSPVGGTGWKVVIQKPASAVFAEIDRMVFSGVVATAVLVGLALIFAVVSSRWVSSPIQRLAETSHEIAHGNFGDRIEGHGLPAELADLADDFNRMSGQLEVTIERLKQAARANRELFIGSIRAFAAAIDAKDPYTRGHSERVASLSRTIARNLSMPEETQQKIWIAALLHDVGKIGVEDQVLRKVGRLTDEEYEQMKQHTVIGAEIMSSIEQLREAVPVIRWHHESWNGRGYPDGKKGEQIPLWARIVAVADTFDAITTNRPYQKAFSLDEATSIITKLTGSRFDAKVVTAFFRAYEDGEVRLPDPGPEPKKVAEKVRRIGVGAFS